MSTQRFHIIVNGKLVTGAALDQVQRNIAQLFKTTPDKVAALFNGKPVVVKKDLEQAAAAKYHAALQQAGLLAEIVPMEGRTSAPSASPAEHTTSATRTLPTGPLGRATLEPVGSQIDQTPAPPPAQIDTSKLSTAAVGEILSKEALPPPANIDTSSLNLAAVGESLAEVQPQPAPHYAIDAISMANPGEIIMEHAPVAEPKIDISKLKLTDQG